MVDGVGPGETQLTEDELQHLEMIVLLVAHHVDHLVETVFVVTLLGGTQVLRHIDRRAVAAQQQLLVEAVACQVAPDRTVVAAVEHALGQTFLHERLAVLVGLGFVIDAVERDAEAAVGLVETGVNPAVHLLPERADFRIALLPFHEHCLRLAKDRRILFGLFGIHPAVHQFLHFGLEQVVELHIVVAHEMVALLPRGLRRLAVAALEPGQH